MEEFLDFWSQCASGDRIHPADERVLSRLDHKFDLTCLPAPFTGPVKSARVVLLFLAPGLADDGYDTEHAKSKEGQIWYYNQLTGISPLPTKNEHKTHSAWLAPRIKQFGFNQENVRDKLAVLDLAPYHSKSFHDYAALSALPSCRAALDLAQRFLFPEAVEGKRAVICLRSPSRWGLRKHAIEGNALCSPSISRSGYMNHGTMREKVVQIVHSFMA